MTRAPAKARGHAGTQVLRHSGTQARRHAGTQGPGARKPPKRQTAADGRESANGRETSPPHRGGMNRPPAMPRAWAWLVACGQQDSGFGNRERANPHGTWNPPQAGRLWNCRCTANDQGRMTKDQCQSVGTLNGLSYLISSTLRHNVESSTAGRRATRGSSLRLAPRRPGRPRKPQ